MTIVGDSPCAVPAVSLYRIPNQNTLRIEIYQDRFCLWFSILMLGDKSTETISEAPKEKAQRFGRVRWASKK